MKNTDSLLKNKVIHLILSDHTDAFLLDSVMVEKILLPDTVSQEDLSTTLAMNWANEDKRAGIFNAKIIVFVLPEEDMTSLMILDRNQEDIRTLQYVNSMIGKETDKDPSRLKCLNVMMNFKRMWDLLFYDKIRFTPAFGTLIASRIVCFGPYRVSDKCDATWVNVLAVLSYVKSADYRIPPDALQ